MRPITRYLLVSLIATLGLALAACSDDSTNTDAEADAVTSDASAESDASGGDASAADATTEDAAPADAGTADATGEDAAGVDTTPSEDATPEDTSTGDTGSATGLASCDDMAALFANTPSTVTEGSCALTNGTTTTCCTMTFRSDLREDGPYCPPSLTSPAPWGLSVYDGATNPGLRPFNGDYLRDIVADGYDAMYDADGNTNIVTGLGGAPPSGSNCLAMEQSDELTITVNIPLTPTMATSPTTIGSVENIGVSIYGVPSTGDPPSAVLGPMGPGGPGPGTGTGINVPSIGACGAHPDPAGYLHDHFIPQVINRVLVANGIGPDEVECTRYTQSTTGLYGFAKDGYPIYSSRDDEDVLPSDLDGCNGHVGPTDEFPGGIYHYHADEAQAPNFMSCVSGVPVRDSFRYR